jgi:CTP:molybdopterin cytidylyltransferase MocA
VRFTEADLRVLAALDQPGTTREVSDRVIAAVREAWAQEEHGCEWEEVETYLPARLLAWGWAKDRGTPPLMPWEVYPRLRKLERAGLVERIQVAGHRPMLWRATERPERA